jgi:hypothetical protein
MKSIYIALASGLLLSACAKEANQVGATYVSPVLYESYTCPQLAEEAQRVSSRAAQSSGVQDQKATNDKVAMGVGLVIFWPALLFTKGNDENTAELARLKGSDGCDRASFDQEAMWHHLPARTAADSPARTRSNGDELAVEIYLHDTLLRHGRACPGHPRLSDFQISVSYRSSHSGFMP